MPGVTKNIFDLIDIVLDEPIDGDDHHDIGEATVGNNFYVNLDECDEITCEQILKLITNLTLALKINNMENEMGGKSIDEYVNFYCKDSGSGSK